MTTKSAFDQRKDHTLKTIFCTVSPPCDKSPKGSVDTLALPIIAQINSHPDYYTTSSCSGRIVLFSDTFLYSTHEIISNDIDVLWDTLQNCKNSFVELKMEPFILHVECRDIPSAKRMHQVAISSGFRNSGMSIGTTDRNIVAVRSTIRMDIPCIVDGILLVKKEQVEVWVGVANEKMRRNWSMMLRLEESIRRLA